jgi:hypothetical protein
MKRDGRSLVQEDFLEDFRKAYLDRNLKPEKVKRSLTEMDDGRQISLDGSSKACRKMNIFEQVCMLENFLFAVAGERDN